MPLCPFCCRQSDNTANNRLSTGAGNEDAVSMAHSDTGEVVDVHKEIKYGKPLRVSLPN